jgi:hypothetical protein
MALQLSPGVAVSEVDLTTVVPSVLTTAGAFAGYFVWGPAQQTILINNEINLVSKFGNPDSNSATSFFSAANFLAYGDNLTVVRCIGSNSKNAIANTMGAATQVANEPVFQYTLLNQNNNNVYGAFMARYSGALGNSLSVSICANTSLFSTWNYANYFTAAPGTSSDATNSGSANDEMHIVVVDSGGQFTGTAGTVLETYPFVSKASNAMNLNSGQSNYYKQVIFNTSKYIYAVDPASYSVTSSTWGTPFANGTSYVALTANQNLPLSGGTDDVGSDSALQSAWSLFGNKDTINVQLLVTGGASIATQQYIIDNIATARQDCIAFISPPQSSVVNQAGSETTNIQTWLTS